MYWVLEWGYELFKNWGLAIIFLTVVVKLVLWPLAAKSYVSMGKNEDCGTQNAGNTRKVC